MKKIVYIWCCDKNHNSGEGILANKFIQDLKKYNPEMLDKSRLIAITKSDLLDDELIKEIEFEIKEKIDEEFIFISSISNLGLIELKDKIWEMLN